MIKKLNSFLRALFVVFGAFYLLTELLPKKVLQDHKDHQDHKEGFDNEEFDDIW